MTFFIKLIQGCFTKTSLVNLLNKCYDRFSSFTKFWSSSERNTENDIKFIFNEESDCSEENTNDDEMKAFTPPFLNHFSLSLNRKKRVVMGVMRKKLNIFTLQLSIYNILE